MKLKGVSQISSYKVFQVQLTAINSSSNGTERPMVQQPFSKKIRDEQILKFIDSVDDSHSKD